VSASVTHTAAPPAETVGEGDGSPTGAPSSRGYLRTIVLAVLAGLATLTFVVAPVVEHTVTYSWDSSRDGGASALPLMPYQPMRLALTIPCGVLRSATGDVVSSYPPGTTTGGASGLQVSATGGSVTVRSNQQTVFDGMLPPGCSTVQISLDDAGARISAGEAVLATHPGDVRPEVVGFFTPTGAAPAAPITATVLADTRFDSSPSTLKRVAAVLAVLFLVAIMLSLRVHDRRHQHRVARRARVRRRRTLRWVRPADVVVGLVLLGWAVIGPSTVDDGYIMTIVRDRGPAGFIGNYARWFNAPEAPFGWFYEPYSLWASITPNIVWMRLPSVLLGVVGWLLLSRILLPRLLPALSSSLLLRVGAASAFLLWWLPYNSGVRPEPFIAVGTALVLVGVDRAVITQRLLPLSLAALAAGLTLGVGPTGVISFTPFLAQLVPLVRMLRRYGRLGALALVCSAGASAAIALLVMFPDESLAAVREATRVRTVIGPSMAWQDEYVRWNTLLTPTYVEGNLFRRVPVLLTVASAMLVGAVVLRDRRVPGLAKRPMTILLGSFALAVAVIAFTPTKWTHHFGAFAVIGAAVVVIGLHALRRSAAQSPRRAGFAVILMSTALALSVYGQNVWWYLSNLNVPFAQRTPAVGPIQLSDALLIVGLVVGAGLIVWSAVATGTRQHQRLARILGTVLTGAMVLGVLGELGSFAEAMHTRPGTYSIGAAGVASVHGDSCLLENSLMVEQDRNAGKLPVTDGTTRAVGFAIDRTAGAMSTLSSRDIAEQPTTAATAAPRSLTTGWFAIPSTTLRGDLPLVVSAAGRTSASVSLTLELRDSKNPSAAPALRPITVDTITPQDPSAGRTTPVDTRIDAGREYPGKDSVRLVATDTSNASDDWIAVAAPRVPVTVPFTSLIGHDQPTAVDWVNSFYFPCVRPAGLSAGAVQIPRYRVTAGNGLVNNSGEQPLQFGRLSNDPAQGGPYVPFNSLITQEKLPVYLKGDVLRDVAHVYALTPKFTSVLTGGQKRDVERSSTAKPGSTAQTGVSCGS